MNTPKITTLAPWFGSNRTNAHKVGELLGDCRWVGIPFAGGMAELVHVKASTIVVNDLHRHIINLARVCSHKSWGPKFYREVKRLAFHPDILNASQWLMKHTYREPQVCKDYYCALAYFVSQWMGRSGKSGIDDEFNGGLSIRWKANGGDSNTRYRSAVSSLVAWRRILQRCTFTVMDCFDFLGKCIDVDRNGIYCDPPFPGPGEKHRHKFSEDDHRRLAETLSSYTRARVVCRFYDHPLIRELYPESKWNWRRFTSRTQANDDRDEVLLVNGRVQVKLF